MKEEKIRSYTDICNISSKPARNAAEYIKEHFKGEFSVDDIADALYLNKSYLMRVFKEHTGVTLLQFLNMTRCEAAKKLLEDTDMCIESIAYEVGYVTASHFTRVFKSIVGATPSNYRRMSIIKRKSHFENI